MHTWIALLRAVNVSGHNLLPMKAFAAALTADGMANVQTYIQSGNAVFRCAEADENAVRARVQAILVGQFGIGTPVVLRQAAELRATVDACPLLAEGTERLHVAFLRDLPKPDWHIDAARSPQDQFALRGRALYLRFGNGAGGTKLTNDYLDRQLATTVTVRNWATTLKIIELARICAEY